MGWIDYKKAYDIVPHLWVKEAVELVPLVGNIKKLLFNSIEKWKNTFTHSK